MTRLATVPMFWMDPLLRGGLARLATVPMIWWCAMDQLVTLRVNCDLHAGGGFSQLTCFLRILLSVLVLGLTGSDTI